MLAYDYLAIDCDTPKPDEGRIMQQPTSATESALHAASPSLHWAVGLAGFVIVLMLGLGLNIALNDGFGHGAGLDTFNAGAADPWQLFINMDLIAGLLLMLGWMVFRQQGAPMVETLAWALLFLWWGNIAVAAYILGCVVQAQGRADAMLLGRRAAPLAGVRALYPILRITGAAVCIAALVIMVRGAASVGFAGQNVFGYVAAFGTLAFGGAVLALSARGARAKAARG
jgi:hypothetical protein